MDFLQYYQNYFQSALTTSELLTLKLLIWLLQVHKQVKIERLAACLPIPILYESRRRKIQRFLTSKKLSLTLFWFPLIKLIIQKEFSEQERLILVLDRTQFNVGIYWKRNYKNNQEKEPWFVITNLPNLDEVIKYYKKRTGIEAMFKDCKTGGYNLEGSKGNEVRLTNLILLIAIAYTGSALKGKLIKNKGYQKYISRLTEAKRKDKRHSDFWVGLYGNTWIFALEFCLNFIQEIMVINKHKLPFYQKGMKAYLKISAIS